MKKKFIDLEKLKIQCVGQWDKILSSLVPEVVNAIEKKTHTFCPVHKGSNGDAFRFFNGLNENFYLNGGGVCNSCGIKPTGFNILMWINGWSFRQALEEVDNFINGNAISNLKKGAKLPSLIKVKSNEVHNSKIIEKNNYMFKNGSVVDKYSPVFKYLSARGIDCSNFLDDMKDIRFVKKMYYAPKISSDGFVSLIRDNYGNPITLHRTWLNNNHLTRSSQFAKKLMPIAKRSADSKGFVVRLGKASNVLAIAEGIETALSVRFATNLVCWSVVSASMMKSFIPPKNVKTLCIFADNDNSKNGNNVGLNSALQLKEKLTINSSLKVIIALPVKTKINDSVDWNDILLSKGKNFRDHSIIF